MALANNARKAEDRQADFEEIDSEYKTMGLRILQMLDDRIDDHLDQQRIEAIKQASRNTQPTSTTSSSAANDAYTGSKS
ncbi:uncharacterized protein N0V89_005224 [Didymosphaeria variabile]|uniref:Uncharacterized protein n=1 Tax=Didymosphaeria variabile TaxID=1932322 RepID=A0A9W8XL33_9PLEO|nr:uncharacterized protein N0V89_005224 [Didymosphaeria variabile]KAJ4353494.1 hypothetical protein N0V89_005224 [Didymosphaeria variabile]